MTTPKDNDPPRRIPELPSYSLDDFVEPVGWRRWLRGGRLIVTLIVITILAGALFGAKPAYRELKARRALAIAEQAGAALDQGDFGQASTLFRQASLMAFQDERVATRLNYYAARAGDIPSLTKIGKKLGEGKASTEEALVFGERSLVAGNIDDAAGALAALPSSLPPAEAVRRVVLQAEILQTRNSNEEAKKLVRDSLAALPADQTNSLRLMLAKMLLGEEGSPGRDEAEQLIMMAAQDQGADGAWALRLLAESRVGGSPEARRSLNEAIELLRRHPASLPSDELFIARLLVASDPSRQDEVAGSLVARLNERQAKVEDRMTAGRWLISLQDYGPALDLIDPAEPPKHMGALMLQLEALTGLGRWEECEAILEANRGGMLPDTLFFLFKARIADLRAEPDRAEAEKRQLRRAMNFDELRYLLFAAGQAESFGWKPEAFTAWRILATGEDVRVEALRGQLRTLPPSSSAADGATIAQELLSLQPDDPTARLTAAYYQLLAGQNTATALGLVESQHTSRNARRLAALAFLREGKAAKGLDIFPGDSGEDRWRALHAALLQAAGRSAEASEAARAINRENLEEGEKDLLRGIAP
jgi:thioredoxin-like negative regulator of GroEL